VPFQLLIDMFLVIFVIVQAVSAFIFLVWLVESFPLGV
jgi:hypothetical protein